jgi:hypothetical protein
VLSKTSSSKLLNPLIGLKFFGTRALLPSECSQCSVQMQKALAAFAAGLPGKNSERCALAASATAQSEKLPAHNPISVSFSEG